MDGSGSSPFPRVWPEGAAWEEHPTPLLWRTIGPKKQNMTSRVFRGHLGRDPGLGLFPEVLVPGVIRVWWCIGLQLR